MTSTDLKASSRSAKVVAIQLLKRRTQANRAARRKHSLQQDHELRKSLQHANLTAEELQH